MQDNYDPSAAKAARDPMSDAEELAAVRAGEVDFVPTRTRGDHVMAGDVFDCGGVRYRADATADGRCTGCAADGDMRLCLLLPRCGAFTENTLVFVRA